jgi:hypothetical protein
MVETYRPVGTIPAIERILLIWIIPQDPDQCRHMRQECQHHQMWRTLTEYLMAGYDLKAGKDVAWVEQILQALRPHREANRIA